MFLFVSLGNLLCLSPSLELWAVDVFHVLAIYLQLESSTLIWFFLKKLLNLVEYINCYSNCAVEPWEMLVGRSNITAKVLSFFPNYLLMIQRFISSTHAFSFVPFDFYLFLSFISLLVAAGTIMEQT